jgi:hypothetical protein
MAVATALDLYQLMSRYLYQLIVNMYVQGLARVNPHRATSQRGVYATKDSSFSSNESHAWNLLLQRLISLSTE